MATLRRNTGHGAEAQAPVSSSGIGIEVKVLNNPYGSFRLNMSERSAIEERAA